MKEKHRPWLWKFHVDVGTDVVYEKMGYLKSLSQRIPAATNRCEPASMPMVAVEWDHKST